MRVKSKTAKANRNKVLPPCRVTASDHAIIINKVACSGLSFSEFQRQALNDSADVTAAYETSDNGYAFMHALEEEGLSLGLSRRGNGFVIVDSSGEIHKISRQLDIKQKGKAKTAAINAKLSGLDLLDGDVLAKQVRRSIVKTDIPETLNTVFDAVSHSEIEAAFFIRESEDKAKLLKRLDTEYKAKETALKLRLKELSPIAHARGLRRAWYMALHRFDEARAQYSNILAQERFIKKQRRIYLDTFERGQRRKLRALKASFKEQGFFNPLSTAFKESFKEDRQARHEQPLITKSYGVIKKFHGEARELMPVRVYT